MKNRKREILVIAIVLIIQTILFIIAGTNKAYIHMDEAYSLGLASYEKVEIQDNQDFYNQWHSKEYYEDYLSVQEDEVGKYKQVYENQKNDVHPPLYYLLLRFAMGFSQNHFSKWPGIIINMVLYLLITTVMYSILKTLLKNQPRAREKAILLAFMSSITMASLTSVIYIRMYTLATLNILITAFLHMKLYEKEKVCPKVLIGIGVSALVGSLTHYYYLFYLSMLFIMFAVKYIKEKRIKDLISYTTTMIIAGIVSLAIFPYSIQHMFFGYRGQGVIEKLTNVPAFLKNVWSYVLNINYFGFNDLLFVILGMIVLLGITAIVIYKIKKDKKEDTDENSKYTKFILLPTLFYFLIVAIASPWTEIRYVIPVCGLMFILAIYYLYQLLSEVFQEKVANILVMILFVVILIMPFIFKIEPEVLYSDRKEIVQKIENELNVPTIYMFNSNNNRFLDDILLFSIIDESYIAKDIEYTQDNIQSILENKDISKGIVIFINEGQDNDLILETIHQAMNFKQCMWLKRLNACDVYYLN